MIAKQLNILVVFALFIPFGIFGQIQSPNAAAAANANGLTGPYSGKPDINFPVTSIRGRSISIPVTLSYNGSGIRVEDMASWVGLGWSLNAGGSITRTVRGIDDFATNGYSNSPSVPSTISGTCNDGGTDLDTYINNVMNGSEDAEPDMFNISFPGFSAQLFLDESGNFHTSPRSAISISRSTASGITSWTVKDLEGYTYYFGQAGTANFTEKDGSIETTWLLRQIVTPVGETVDFTYTNNTLTYSLLPSERYDFKYGGTCTSLNDNVTITSRDVSITVKQLSEISINNTSLSFETSDRCDVSGADKLQKIVYKEGAEEIRAFEFDYTCDPSKQRLWLESMRQLGSSGDALPPTRFEYINKSSFPALKSYAQDYWGYYNGQVNNTKLTPSYLESGVFAFSGAIRDPHDTYVEYGTLNKVILPSGGSITYEWGAHKYDNYGSFYPEIITTNYEEEVAQGARSGIISNGSTSFTLSVTTSVTFEVILDALGLNPSSTFEVRLVKSGSTIETWSSSTTETLSLTSGTYTLIADIGSNDSQIFMAIGRANYSSLTQNPPQSEMSGGGIRIERITSDDGLGNSPPIITRYDYTVFSGSATSGKLMTGPVHHHEIRSYCSSSVYADFRVLTSESVTPLSTSAAGSYVGYSEVTIFDSNGNTEGKKELTFYNVEDPFYERTTSLGTQKVPGVPPSGEVYKNGLLDKQTDYRFHGGSFYKVREHNPDYNFVGELSIPALIIADETHVTNQCSDILYAIYSLKTAWVQTREEVVTLYDGNGSNLGSSIVTDTDYTYYNNEPWLVKNRQTQNSDSDIYYTDYYYAQHFNGSVFGGVISSLLADNRVATLIQRINKRSTGAVYSHFEGVTTVYSSIAGTQLPTAVYGFEYQNLVTGFIFNSADPLNDSRFKLQQNYSYDTDGNLVKSYFADSRSVSIIGYDDDLVMAKAANADLNEVAFTSFETSDHGNWTYSSGETTAEKYTGKKSFSGSTVTASVPSGNYVVSMWAKGTGNVSVNSQSKSLTSSWKYYEWLIESTASVSVSNAGYIDELRLYPVGALMTSYTYDPEIGVTSVAGPDGRPSFMEYDEFSRQTTVRDMNKDILSLTEYTLSEHLHAEIVPPSGGADLDQSQQWTLALSDDLPSGLTISWNFGDGTSSVSGQTVNHTYTKLGDFNVEVTLSKSGYTTRKEYKNIRVQGTLQGSFPSLSTPLDNLTTFTLNNTNKNPAGTTYEWSILQNEGISLVYAAGRLGHFPVSVDISHPNYATRQISGTIIVTGPMVADWTPPSGALKEDEVFQFKAINNQDNPTDATYSWTFTGNGSATGATVNKSFTSPTISNMSVILTVSRTGYTSVHEDHDVSTTYANPAFSNWVAGIGNQELDILGVYNGRAPYTYKVTYSGGGGQNHTTSSTSHTFNFSFSSSKTITFWVEDADGRSSASQQTTIVVFP